MIYLTIILALFTVVALIRLFFVKKEVKSIARQLKHYNHNETEKKIDITLFDKDIEMLAVEINHQFDLIVQANAKKRRTELELKQAIANISHDIRTPLTSIFGYIQLLESDDLTLEEKKEYVAVIKSRTQRLQTLLNDFFELSVIESADYYLKLESIKMNDLVPETLMAFYDQFNDRNVEPTIDLPQGEMTIIADESAVKRVIENLIVNAIRHSSGNIGISLERLQSTAVLTISNDASRLTENDLNLLFNRFYTADQTRSGKSTGLGLSIAKSLMSKMDGKLSAELKDGQLYMRCIWNL